MRFGVTFAFLKKPASGLVVWLSLRSSRPRTSAMYPSFSSVRLPTTTTGPASMTVTRVTLPSGSKSWVEPSFRPKMPG